MNPTDGTCYHLINARWRKCTETASYVQIGSGIPLCTGHAQALQKRGAKIKPITPTKP